MCACTHMFPRRHANAASFLPGYRRDHHRPPPPPPPHRPTLQRHIHHCCHLLFVSHTNWTTRLSSACVVHIKGPGDVMTKNHPVAPMRGYSPRADQAINHDNQIKERKPPQPPHEKRFHTREAEQLLPWSAKLPALPHLNTAPAFNTTPRGQPRSPNPLALPQDGDPTKSQPSRPDTPRLQKRYQEMPRSPDPLVLSRHGELTINNPAIETRYASASKMVPGKKDKRDEECLTSWTGLLLRPQRTPSPTPAAAAAAGDLPPHRWGGRCCC